MGNSEQNTNVQDSSMRLERAYEELRSQLSELTAKTSELLTRVNELEKKDTEIKELVSKTSSAVDGLSEESKKITEDNKRRDRLIDSLLIVSREMRDKIREQADKLANKVDRRNVTRNVNIMSPDATVRVNNSGEQITVSVENETSSSGNTRNLKWARIRGQRVEIPDGDGRYLLINIRTRSIERSNFDPGNQPEVEVYDTYEPDEIHLTGF